MMQRFTRVLMMVVALEASMAIADEPPAVPAGAQAAPTATSATPATPAPAPATPPDASKPAAPTDAQIKKWRGQGYKPEVRDGQTYFCHLEAPLGSRLEKRTCSTAAQMEARAQADKELVDDMQRRNNIAPSGK